MFCALGALVLSWSVSFAYLARKRNWSPQTCMKAGLPLAAVGVLIVAALRAIVGSRRLDRCSHCNSDVLASVSSLEGLSVRNSLTTKQLLRSRQTLFPVNLTRITRQPQFSLHLRVSVPPWQISPLRFRISGTRLPAVPCDLLVFRHGILLTFGVCFARPMRHREGDGSGRAALHWQRLAA